MRAAVAFIVVSGVALTNCVNKGDTNVNSNGGSGGTGATAALGGAGGSAGVAGAAGGGGAGGSVSGGGTGGEAGATGGASGTGGGATGGGGSAGTGATGGAGGTGGSGGAGGGGGGTGGSGGTAPTWMTGLISWWKLDEGSGQRADSVGANHLTPANSIGAQAGKLGQAASFDSSSAHDLSIGDNSSLSAGSTSFTISAWVRLNNVGKHNWIVAKEGPSPGWTTVEYSLAYINTPPNSRFNFAISDSATASWNVKSDSAGVPASATWYFVVGWYDKGAGTVNIQVNGGTVDSKVAGGTQGDGANAFHIGRTPYNGQTDGMHGLIDEVGFWKRVLTSTERADLYNGGAGRTVP